VVPTAVIPALGGKRQEEPKLKASLGYITRPCFKNRTKQSEGRSHTGGRAMKMRMEAAMM
jgi:hypothetical protein